MLSARVTVSKGNFSFCFNENFQTFLVTFCNSFHEWRDGARDSMRLLFVEFGFRGGKLVLPCCLSQRKIDGNYIVTWLLIIILSLKYRAFCLHHLWIEFFLQVHFETTSCVRRSWSENQEDGDKYRVCSHTLRIPLIQRDRNILCFRISSERSLNRITCHNNSRQHHGL